MTSTDTTGVGPASSSVLVDSDPSLIAASSGATTDDIFAGLGLNATAALIQIQCNSQFHRELRALARDYAEQQESALRDQVSALRQKAADALSSAIASGMCSIAGGAAVGVSGFVSGEKTSRAVDGAGNAMVQLGGPLGEICGGYQSKNEDANAANAEALGKQAEHNRDDAEHLASEAQSALGRGLEALAQLVTEDAALMRTILSSR